MYLKPVQKLFPSSEKRDATEIGCTAFQSVVWMNQAYSRLSTTHGHITDCKLLVCMYWIRLVLVRPAASLYSASPLKHHPTGKLLSVGITRKMYHCLSFAIISSNIFVLECYPFSKISGFVKLQGTLQH